MSFKLKETVKVLSALAPLPQPAGTVTGSVIDCFGYGDAVVLLDVGAATGTPSAQSVSLKVQHSAAAAGTDPSDVPDGAIEEITIDSTTGSVGLDLSGLQRYVFVSVTTALTGGTSPKIPVSATLVLGNSIAIPTV